MNGLKAILVEKIKRFSRKFVYHSIWQLSMSIAIGAVIVIMNISVYSFHGQPIMVGASEYFAVVVGLATILTLASTVTFGFLTYYLQAIDAERLHLYARFNEQLKYFREGLEALHQDGLINQSYSAPLASLEALQLIDFPLGDWWDETINEIIDLVPGNRQSKGKSQHKRERILNTIGTRGAHLEETVNEINVNGIKRILVQVMLRPVIKSFRIVVVVVLAILLAAVYYKGLYAMLLDGLAFGIGCMTVLLFTEISFQTAALAKEYRTPSTKSEGDGASNDDLAASQRDDARQPQTSAATEHDQ